MRTLKNIVVVALLSFPMILTLSFQPSPVRFAEEAEATVIKTLVIDAGHGGKDPGCHGASAHEKDVCLAMALELGKAIQAQYPNIKVIYTRDKDVFVELDERAKIANKANANLFICIHANSASPSAFGTETYVLGLHRTDAQAKIADRENSVIEFEADQEKYKNFDMTPDALILRQLQLSVYLDHSISFAEKLQAEFKTLGRYDRGVRQAGFLVLYKTTMPSVLIETGFLTNAQEEQFLADKENQKKMAQAMFSAFEKYKKEREGVDSQTKGGGQTTTQKIETNGTPPNTSATTNTANTVSQDVYFRVQIETSETKVSLTASKFKGLTIQEYKQDNLFKYTAGDFKNDFKLANNYKN